MWWLIPALALGSANAGAWTQIDARDDCRFYVGEKMESGLAPVRASCDWALSATKLQHLLSQVERHHLYFELLEFSNLISTDGNSTLIYQQHSLAGVPDREVIVRTWIEPIENGFAYHWTKADDQSALSGRGVEVEENTGKWQVTSTAEGLHLEYEVLYSPGGWVPPFVVRWFQGKGTVTTIQQLRTYLEAY